MRCVSLWQPWASLIAIGAKRVETRSWSTPYRGPIAIHAAKRWTREERDVVLDEPFLSALIRGYGEPFRLNPTGTLPLGAIVAVGHLHRCGRVEQRRDGQTYIYGRELPVTGAELDFGNYEAGRFGWVLTNVGRLKEPIPYRGKQGIWDLESDVVAAIERQLAVAS